MEREGFGPSKAEPTDLQSAPFDRSGTSPKWHSYLSLLLKCCQYKITKFLSLFLTVLTILLTYNQLKPKNNYKLEV